MRWKNSSENFRAIQKSSRFSKQNQRLAQSDSTSLTDLAPKSRTLTQSASYIALNLVVVGCDAYKPDTRKNQRAADNLQRHDRFFEQRPAHELYSNISNGGNRKGLTQRHICQKHSAKEQNSTARSTG